MTKSRTNLSRFMAAIILLGAGTAYADITLQVDDNIKVTAINGQSISQSAFQPLKKTFTLKPGKHVITAKYDRLYDLRTDDHDYLRSGNVTVTADMMQDNQTYRLTMPGQPERYEDAKEFAKNPILAVEQGGQIIAQQQGASDSGGIFAGLTGAVGGLFGGGNAQQQNQQVIASIDTPTDIPKSSAAATQSIANITPVQVPANASTLDQFMQLWLQATPAEREKIRGWVQE